MAVKRPPTMEATSATVRCLGRVTVAGRRVQWLIGASSAVLLLSAWPAVPAAAESDTTPPSEFDFFADAGDYQTGYGVASPYNNIYVSWGPSFDDESNVSYEITVDGVVTRTIVGVYGYPIITKRIEVPDGHHVVAVNAVDASSNRRASTHTLDVVIDKISPVFTSWPRLLMRTGPVTTDGYPMRYTWSGSDEGTGLVDVRIGPNPECCYQTTPDRTHFDFTIPPRSEMVWRVFLIDGVGRMVKTPRDGYVAPVAWNKTSRSDGWRRAVDESSLDGSEWVSTSLGEKFRVKAEGKSIGWVTSTGPKRGRADVLVNGRLVDSVNLYSAARRPARVVWTTMLPKNEAATITIVNRSPSSRRTVGVDALLVQN